MKKGKEFRAEVAVVGGGVAGLAAAVAAARAGAGVCLVENNGFLGGIATAGLVGRFQEGPYVKGNPVIRGLYKEICQRLQRYGALRGELFDPESMKYVAFDLCEENGVKLLLHSKAYEVDVQSGHVEGLYIATKQRSQKVRARVYVDATGDGTLSALAGARFKVGRETDGLQQPMTLVFQLGNVETGRLKTVDWEELSAKFRREVKGLSSRSRIFYFEFTEGLLGFVMTHVAGLNPLDVEDLTRAEIESRRHVLQIQRFFRGNVPGCERCVIATSPVEIGIRESRRVVGDYVLTREDVLGARKFEDSICCSTSWIDIHNPDGVGVLHELTIPDDWFEVPFRAVVVKDFDNLLVAGRCMSTTHEAQGAIREIPTCIAVGQGAGVAAAIAARKRRGHARSVDVRVLKRELVDQGVNLRQ